MNVLESMQYVVSELWGGVWSFMKSFMITSTVSYASAIIGIVLIMVIISKFWKSGGGD